MARWRQAVELGMTDEEIGTLAAIARSRSEAARRVERAQILLTYRENPSFFAVGQRLGVHHQTVQRGVERNHSAHISRETTTWPPLDQPAASSSPSRPSTAPGSGSAPHKGGSKTGAQGAHHGWFQGR
jgi:hypothetical protein